MELTRKLLDSSAVTLADHRQVRVICSTGDPDRMGDVIVQNGIDLTAYRKNPIVLWGHSADVPIARAIRIDISEGKLQATAQFPPEGDDEDADWVYGKIKAGIVNATSVGFIPKVYEPLNSKQPWKGTKFLKSELCEFSFVSVPANAGCLVVGRSIFNMVDIPLLPSMVRSSNGKSASRSNLPLAEKSGRRISAANEALLREAIDHHESATECIREVLDEPDEDGAGENDPPGDGKAIDRRAKRLAEASALAAKARAAIASSTSDAPAQTREERVAEARNLRRAMMERGT